MNIILCGFKSEQNRDKVKGQNTCVRESNMPSTGPREQRSQRDSMLYVQQLQGGYEHNIGEEKTREQG